MGSQSSKKDRFLKHITSRKRDLVYNAYDHRSVINLFSSSEVRDNMIVQRLSEKLSRPEFRRMTIHMLQQLTEHHYDSIIKYVIPKLLTLDIFSRSITRQLFTHADFVEDVLVLINDILLRHADRISSNQGIIILGFLKNCIILPFPKFHFRRTQILCRVYIGLQCLAAIAFPFSDLQKYAWKTLDVLLRSMNLLLIETVIFIQKGRFESLVLEYRGQKVCEVKGALACNCLFKLSRSIIHQVFSEKKVPLKTKNLDNQQTVQEKKKIKSTKSKKRLEEKEEFDIMKNKALIDWAVRSVIRIFENSTISKLLYSVGWMESLVEIVLFSKKKEYVLLGIQRVLGLLDTSEETRRKEAQEEEEEEEIRLEEEDQKKKKRKGKSKESMNQSEVSFHIKKLFHQIGKKDLHLLIAKYENYLSAKKRLNDQILREGGAGILNNSPNVNRSAFHNKIEVKIRREIRIEEDEMVRFINQDENEENLKKMLFRKVKVGKKSQSLGDGFSDVVIVCHEF